MRRDVIYYQLFKRYPALLFELIDQRPDGADRYQFDSVEVKETSFRIDGVLIPPEDAETKRVFFAEVQFQPDQNLYHRFFTELFIWLYRNQDTYDDWHGTIIFSSRDIAPTDDRTHRAFLASDQISCLYLDELGELENLSLGLALVKRTVLPETETITSAKRVIQNAKKQPDATLPLEDIIELVTTIAVYKLTSFSRKEIAAMLDLQIKETRVYREIKEEGRDEGREEGERNKAVAVARKLLAEDASLERTPDLERIADLIGLSAEQVLQIQNENNDERVLDKNRKAP